MSYRLHLRRAYLLLTSSQTTFVIDIDGTVADISHRQSLIEQDPPDWDTFFDPDLVMKDKPKKVKKILKDIIDKYGADALRLALMSFASPDKDTNWDEKVLIGSSKFLTKVYKNFKKIKIGKSDKRIESKLHKTIKISKML